MLRKSDLSLIASYELVEKEQPMNVEQKLVKEKKVKAIGQTAKGKKSGREKERKSKATIEFSVAMAVAAVLVVMPARGE